MDMIEAMARRHMVRQYQDIDLSANVIKKLMTRIESNNQKYHLSMKLMVNDTKAVNVLAKLILAKGVKNYLILAGTEEALLEEKLGYCGADFMLYAQTLGLNSWYVGGMFNRKVAQFVDGQKVIGIIAIGYGRTQGVPHQSKKANEVSHYQGDAPEWFAKGVETALLAPTALNKQDFFITGSGHKVQIENDNGIFTGANRGLIKYHFELGAGKDNFSWE